MIDLSQAIRACGTPSFATQLRAAIAIYLKAQSSGLLQYSRFAIPHYLVRDHVPEDEITFYLAGVYRLDPFFRHWRETGRPGILALHELQTQAGSVGESAQNYVRRFQPKTGMADEIALLLPKIGGAVDNFFFLRGEPFSDEECALLRAQFTTLKALHDLNQTLFLRTLESGQSAPIDFPDTDAFVIDDSEGRLCCTSRDWHDIVGQDFALSEAVQSARTNLSGDPIVLENAHVLSERLGDDFPLAPNGRITFVVRRPLAAPPVLLSDVMQQLFKNRLTPREIAICHLVLQGFPSSTISQKLDIALGTVKNHRKSIYRKLDITTERELFLLLLNQLGAK